MAEASGPDALSVLEFKIVSVGVLGTEALPFGKSQIVSRVIAWFTPDPIALRRADQKSGFPFDADVTVFRRAEIIPKPLIIELQIGHMQQNGSGLRSH
jgi:hypothetical protein